MNPEFPNPCISIILTTYNRAGLILRAIDSVLAQTFCDWELIIIDDGSTDDTAQRLEPLLESDDRLIYFHQENQGYAAACNAGFRMARGAWITLLDSDDEYLPEHLQTRLDWMRGHPELDLAHGGFEVIGSPDDWYVPDANDPARRIHLSECVAGGTFFGRAKVFRELQGFDQKLEYAHDFDFANRAAEGFRIARVEIPTYLYHRDHPHGICREMQSKDK